jgi:hypothetical protein
MHEEYPHLAVLYALCLLWAFQTINRKKDWMEVISNPTPPPFFPVITTKSSVVYRCVPFLFFSENGAFSISESRAINYGGVFFRPSS